MKVGLSLMKNMLQLFAKSVLVLLGLTATAVADAGSPKKIFGFTFGTAKNSIDNIK